jgi:hypothetical protein
MPISLEDVIAGIERSNVPAAAKKKAIELARIRFQEETGEPEVTEPDEPVIPKPDIPVIDGLACGLCSNETVMDIPAEISPCLTCGFVNDLPKKEEE